MPPAETILAALALVGAVGNLLELFPKTRRFGACLASVTADFTKLAKNVKRGAK